MQALDPQLALTPPVRMRDGVLRTVSTQRLAAVVVGVFSLAALLIAAAGLHGVLAFGVAQRRRELGIRLALGATAGNVLRLVARDGLVLAVAGLGLGLLVAYGAAGAIRGLLVDVSPADPDDVCRRRRCRTRGGAPGDVGAGAGGDAHRSVSDHPRSVRRLDR